MTSTYTSPFPPLEQVTKPNLKTAEAAFYLDRAAQSLRCWAARPGSGPLTPKKIQGLLAWSTTEIKSLVEGSSMSANVTADCAEQAGGLLAHNVLNAMLATPNQAVSVAALQTALLDLKRLPYPERAAVGFAENLVAVLERGIGASL
jgi:hypothetical protein